MHIRKLVLQNFRIYTDLQIEFPEGLTIIVGPNASGKTSLLEAIHVLATSKSPRTNSDRQLVREGTAFSRVHGEFVSSASDTTDISVLVPGPTSAHGALAAQLAAGKQVKLDGFPIESVSQLVGRCAVVMFTTEDLEIVKGPPGARRRFLNVAIAQLRPRYLDDHLRYRRALSQRNEILKTLRTRGGDSSTLTPWNIQLIDAGAPIAGDREEFVETLAEGAELIHGDLTDLGETLVLEYQSDLAGLETLEERKTHFAALLSENQERDIELGYTSAGPHRDDFGILIDDRALRRFGSQGQQRTAALSLKLAQADVVMAWRGEPPLLLLDDCLSELDACRCNRVLELAQNLQGLIITSPVLTEILAAQQSAAFYQVDDGVVIRIGPDGTPFDQDGMETQ